MMPVIDDARKVFSHVKIEISTYIVQVELSDPRGKSGKGTAQTKISMDLETAMEQATQLAWDSYNDGKLKHVFTFQCVVCLAWVRSNEAHMHAVMGDET